MDEASSELLRFLRAARDPSVARLRDAPARARADSRPPRAVPPVPALTLRLEPLPVADARKLVEAAAGEAASRRTR